MSRNGTDIVWYRPVSRLSRCPQMNSLEQSTLNRLTGFQADMPLSESAFLTLQSFFSQEIRPDSIRHIGCFLQVLAFYFIDSFTNALEGDQPPRYCVESAQSLLQVKKQWTSH